MDLIERYLAAIGRELPQKERSDILAELREVLVDKLDTLKAAAGGKASRTDVEAMLIGYGHPLTIAGRYRGSPSLIGPEVFPFWWKTMKMALVIVAIVYLALAGVMLFSGQSGHTVARYAENSLQMALAATFGVVTLVFAGIERFGKPAMLTRWKPRNLPPAGRRTGPFERIAEAVSAAIFLLWWTGAIHFRPWLPDTGLWLGLAPVWAAWFWPILGYSAFEIASNLFALAQPQRVVVNGTMRMLKFLLGAAIMSGVYEAGHWIDVSAPYIPATALAILQTNMDLGMKIGVGMTVLIMLCMAGVEAWRLWRLRGIATAGVLA
jgi:hypothetical protein